MKSLTFRAFAVFLSLQILVGLTGCKKPAATPDPAPAVTSQAPTVSQPSASEPPESSVSQDQSPHPPESTVNPGASPQEPGGVEDIDGEAAEPPEHSPGPIEVDRIIVGLDSASVLKGTILDPNVTVLPMTAVNRSYTLTTDNDSILRQVYGFWTAVGGGTARLIATAANGVTGSITVTVNVPLEGVALSAGEITLNRGDSVTLTPIFAPEDTTETYVTFTSGDEDVATVSGDGTIRATGPGVAEIRCVAGDFEASCSITVLVPVTGISMSTDKRVYRAGERGSFTVNISPQDATDQSFSTEVSGSAISLTGTNSFSCDAAGEATITVTAANGMTASQSITVIDLVAYANEVFRLTNNERINAGLEPCSMMSSLTQAAVVRAGEIITSFSHDRPDGRDCFTALDESNVSYMAAGENIAMGQRSPAEVVRAWMDSPGHRENIMNSDFTYLGAGVAMDSNGRLYWSQFFAG